MKALAIGLMMWMQANCNVPGVHMEQDFCDLRLNLPAPNIVLIDKQDLFYEFQNQHGKLAAGISAKDIIGFYNFNSDTIYLESKRDYFNDPLAQTNLVHELVHYIQDMNNVPYQYCSSLLEIPAYLMQLHVYNKKFGLRATAPDMYRYNESCNTLY
tara:strand:- start:223 stop:690 length:468 start_codon:yes stop_codon:yes gene_type:complete